MRVLIVIGLVLLAGCATPQQANTLAVTFESFPAGAVLIQNGSVIGQLPMTLTYKLTPEDIANGKLQSIPIGAKWMSGATTTLSPNYSWQSGTNKLTSRTIFQRPAAAPGLETDMAVQARIQQAAEPTAEELQMWHKLGESIGAAAASRR